MDGKEGEGVEEEVVDVDKVEVNDESFEEIEL